MSIGMTRGFVHHTRPPHPGFGRTDPIDRGLVAEWRFDPISGLVLIDWSGYSNHGVVNGTTNWEGTEHGLALNLVPDAYVDCGSPPSLDNITTAVTLEAFVNPDTWNAWSGLITKTDGAGDVADYQYALFTQNIAGQFRWSITDQAADFATAGLATGQWYHAALTVGSDVRTYLNGQPDGAPAVKTGSLTEKAASVDVGRLVGSGHWDGKIALARIYNRALSPIEVAKRYEIVQRRGNETAALWPAPTGKWPRSPRYGFTNFQIPGIM